MAEKKLAPGTLDHTRQNIGPIDPVEAAKMQKVLGGEVLQERSVPVNPDSLPKSKKRNRAVVKGSGLSSSDVSAQSGSANLPKMSGSTGMPNKAGSKMIKSDDDLQEMTAHDIKMIDRLMMSEAYDLKPDRGVFNFFYNLSSKNRRKLSKSYGDYKIKSNVDHLQAFISTIKTFIQISPDTYKAKIATETDLKFKFLRSVGKWTVHDIKIMGEALQENSSELTVGMMVPFVCAVYKELLTVYYIGDQKVATLIKDIYNDLVQYPKVDKAQVQTLAKQGITEWLYVVDQMVRGMYPLLMRMCGSGYETYPKFFTSQAGQILKFVGLSKFDLLIAEKEKPAEQEKVEEVKKEEKKPAIRQMGEFDDLTKSGLKVLEQLFPDAGFSNLDKHPDMFPYFQPIYKFDDGFNMLSPMNGIQVLVVLLQIIEDFFQGCRNVDFKLGEAEGFSEGGDDLSTIFSEWSNYREDLFLKQYGEYLRQFVNTAYSQRDYPQTQFGKENLNNMLWRAKYYFFPSLKFSAPTLTKPQNDSKYRPLNIRADYLKTVLTTLVRRIDENQAGKKPVLGILNPWNRYSFDIPNPISKRLDVLLGAKRPDDVTSATNANLLKYTLCVISVLDWWVNNPSSPAYITDTAEVYRIDKDGGPGFSAPERSDQNKLFADAVKAAASKGK
ncbi:MAG: hypothetical protein ILP18_03580 [Treponema sp.]|nr:hypothetical protein [Treponema sp.]